MVRMIGGARMVGGAETALLTLDENAAGGPGGASGNEYAGVSSNNAPKKFTGFAPSYTAMKTIINKFNEKERPNKKDVKMAASEIFDIYSYSTPQARGQFDSSVPLNGFVEELGQVVSLPPAKVHYFFNSLLELIQAENPSLDVPTPVLNQQAALPIEQAKGSGKGCGCCGGCCGGAEMTGGMPGVGNRGVFSKEAQQAHEARGFKTLDWAKLRPKTRDYLHQLYTRLREYSSPEATLDGMVDNITPRTAPKDLKEFFEEAAVFDDDVVMNKAKLKHYITDFLKMKGLYGTGYGGAEPEKPAAPADVKPSAPADVKPLAMSAKPASNIVQNVLEWVKKNKASYGKDNAAKLTTLEQEAKKNDKENPPLLGSARKLVMRDDVASVNALLAKGKKLARGGAYGRTQRKQVLPGRVQKLRAKLAEPESESESESESDEDSDKSSSSSLSDEEKVSGGAKRGGKRSQIVKRVMKQRGVSMIEASKIVKSEGLY